MLPVLTLMVFLVTAEYGTNQMSDTRAASQSSWSPGTRGTLALPDDWRGDIDWEVEGRDGRLYTNRFPGPIFWAMPFYAVSGWLFPDDQLDHSLHMHYAPAGVAAALATALAVAVSYLLHRRLADRRLAVAATLVLAFGTGVWTVAASALWTHSLTYLTLTLGLIAAADGRHARSGLAFAAAILSRPQVAVVPAVVDLWTAITDRRLGPLVVMGLAASLGLAGIIFYNWMFFRTLLPVAGYDPAPVTALVSTSARDYLVSIVAVLSPYRGIFIFMPILIVLLPAFHHGWRASPWWVRATAIAGLVCMLVQLRRNVWHGGRGFFGPRVTIETLVLASPLLLRTWQTYGSQAPLLRRVGLTLAVGGILLHSLGATVWAYDVGFGGAGADWASLVDRVCTEHPVGRSC